VIVTATPYVYWLGNDGKFYRMAGGNPEPLSLAVQSASDSMFPTEKMRREYARAIRWNDRIILSNDSTGVALSYWFMNNLWVKFPTVSAAPIVAVRYDTSTTDHVLPVKSDKILYDVVVGFSIQDTLRATTVVVGTDTTAAPVIYQTPFVGDGKQQWQMMEAQITATGTSGSYLKAEVIDDKGTTLATDSLLLSSASDYRLGFAVNVGKYLSVKFTSGSTCTNLQLGEVVLYATPVGTIGLQ